MTHNKPCYQQAQEGYHGPNPLGFRIKSEIYGTITGGSLLGMPPFNKHLIVGRRDHCLAILETLEI